MKNKKTILTILSLLLCFVSFTKTIYGQAPPSGISGEASIAIALNFVPEPLQARYTAPITRGEFCQLIVEAVALRNPAIRVELDSSGMGAPTVHFAIAKSRGIIDDPGYSISNRRFITQNITRLEAAKILFNASGLMGDITPAETFNFTDQNQISGDYIKAAATITTALKDRSNGFPVMELIDGEFLPSGNITREEAIVIAKRLFYAFSEEDELDAMPSPVANAAAGALQAQAASQTAWNMPEPTVFTSAQLALMIEQAPHYALTRPSKPHPARRMTQEEQEEWIKDYNAKGGINAQELELYKIVNEIRAEHGLPPFILCPRLSMASRLFSYLQVKYHTTGHSDRYYDTMRNRMNFFGVTGSMYMENANVSRWTPLRDGGRAYIYLTPQELVDGWMRSSAHRGHILTTNTTHIGFGVDSGNNRVVPTMKSVMPRPLQEPRLTIGGAQATEADLMDLLSGFPELNELLRNLVP